MKKILNIKAVLLFFLIGSVFALEVGAEDYKIVIGDKLRISVWGNKNLDDEVTVRPDGKISFDLIGDVKAESLKPMELRRILKMKLAEFIKDPEVTVKLISTDRFRIFIVGSVPGSGERTLQSSTTLIQFFSTILPIPGNIDLQKSYLIRNNKKLDVNFYELLINDDLASNIFLQSQDTIVFKEKKVKAGAKKEAVNPFRTDIRIIGAIQRPGRITYSAGMSLLDAIIEVGGFTDFANPSETVVSRKSKNKIEQIIIDMEAVQAGEIDKDITLKPGDIISVPESIW